VIRSANAHRDILQVRISYQTDRRVEQGWRNDDHCALPLLMGRAGIDPDPTLIDLRFEIDAGIDRIRKADHRNEKLLPFEEERQRFQSPGSEAGSDGIVIPEPEAWRAGHGAREVARAGFAMTEEVGIGHPLL